ncbi:MAG: M56/M15 family metallopeptidase [Chitinophagaceae bacterium]
MKFLIYAGQVILLSGLLYGYYHLFLRNRSFHRYNRFFLLMACLMSLLIPCITIPLSWPSSAEASPGVVRLLETVYVTMPEDETAVAASISAASERTISWPVIAAIIYGAIALFFLFRLVIGLTKLRTLATRYSHEQLDGIKLFHTKEGGTPFSFFRLIFWNDEIDLRSENGKKILRHELIHIKQKHSYDVLFTELLIIFCWINPFFHLIKKELRIIHEFLADEPVAIEDNCGDYAELLLMHSLRTQKTLVNPFFHNQLKRRIVMITKPRINKSMYARQLMILPLSVVLFAMFAFRLKPVTITSSGKEGITVVVDAGHGGFDPGAKSPDKKFEEAAMTLEFATLMQSLAPEYGIRVVLTRENESAIGSTKQEDLMNRLKISKNARPDLFFSFHINTTGRDTYQASRSGFDVMIAGKREDARGRAIASVLLEQLSNVYKADKVVKRRSDAGIYVLDQNDVPAVMLQCGYINNQKDLEFFNAKENREKVVRTILSVLRDNAKS